MRAPYRSVVLILATLPLVVLTTDLLVTKRTSGQRLSSLLVTLEAAGAQSEAAGNKQFLDQCIRCHGNVSDVPNAPNLATLKLMPPERIYETMTTGSMQSMAQDLSDAEKRLVAEFLAGRKMDTAEAGAAESMPNVCATHPPIRDLSAPAWNGWGVDLSNTRFQPAEAARLSAGQASRLELKWAFGFPAATALYGQTVVDGRLFVGSNAGYVYSLDAETGCVHWSFRAKSGVRSGFVIGPVKQGAGHAAFFGDIHGNVYAVDASTGDLLWTVPIDPHPLSRITGTPKLYEGRLYVAVASLEEDASGSANSVCCTFRGMVGALDAETGRQIWKTYMISEEPKPIRKNSVGKDHWGPSGAGVWASPTIDPKRNAIYVATGNAFSEPVTKTSDAVLALDMDSGKVLWSMQAHPSDIWHQGCVQNVPGRPLPPGGIVREGYPPENCPEATGPDWDFASSPILTTLPNGRSVVIAAQKHGLVWALDPDQEGAVIWKQDVAREITGGRGETLFGGAVVDQRIYFGLVSSAHIALDLSSGTESWFSPVVPPKAMAEKSGIVAAVSLIPGVLFSGGRDGMLRAVSSTNGQSLWEFNTAQAFETVNGVAAKGGSIGAGGPTIAQGMVFVGSGYVGFQGGVAGNVLLAFAPRVRLDTIAEGHR